MESLGPYFCVINANVLCNWAKTDAHKPSILLIHFFFWFLHLVYSEAFLPVFQLPQCFSPHVPAPAPPMLTCLSLPLPRCHNFALISFSLKPVAVFSFVVRALFVLFPFVITWGFFWVFVLPRQLFVVVFTSEPFEFGFISTRTCFSSFWKAKLFPCLPHLAYSSFILSFTTQIS